MPANPKHNGERVEAAIIAELLDNGVSVLQPFGENHRYDLVIELKNSFYRLQAKKARTQNGCVIFSTRSSQPRTGGHVKSDYHGDIDFFVTTEGLDSTTYMILIEDASSNEMRLRVSQPKNNQAKGINWATEYTLSKQIKSIEGT